MYVVSGAQGQAANVSQLVTAIQLPIISPDYLPTLLTQQGSNQQSFHQGVWPGPQYAPQKSRSRQQQSGQGGRRQGPAARRTPSGTGSAAQASHGASSSAAARALPAQQGHSQADTASKGAISLLQEFVQCSKHIQNAQHRPILQWEFDQRMADHSTLEFSATVAFLLDGVPHHVAGGWHLSKKFAQRDAAERALGFFITVWGDALLEAEKEDAPDQQQSAGCGSSGLPSGEDDQPRECQDLSEYCARSSFCDGDASPRWTIISRDEDGWCATVEIAILGVAHKFGGAPRRCETEARVDTAKRVLWYLQCPGYENAFELDINAHVSSTKDIPPAPPRWTTGGCGSDDMQMAERNTSLMRVQNRLQQAFAGFLKPGQSVCEWSYENDSDDASTPPRCRATLHVPVIGRSFTGSWVRGQREAQIDAGVQVSAFLDGPER